MAYKSQWEEHVETYVNKALSDYQEGSRTAGFHILSYLDKGVLQVKQEFTDIASDMFEEWGPTRNPKYVYLRLAKLGALEWNGSA
jgi:hypothetical protein